MLRPKLKVGERWTSCAGLKNWTYACVDHRIDINKLAQQNVKEPNGQSVEVGPFDNYIQGSIGSIHILFKDF